MVSLRSRNFPRKSPRSAMPFFYRDDYVDINCRRRISRYGNPRAAGQIHGAFYGIAYPFYRKLVCRWRIGWPIRKGSVEIYSSEARRASAAIAPMCPNGGEYGRRPRKSTGRSTRGNSRARRRRPAKLIGEDTISGRYNSLVDLGSPRGHAF